MAAEALAASAQEAAAETKSESDPNRKCIVVTLDEPGLLEAALKRLGLEEYRGRWIRVSDSGRASQAPLLDFLKAGERLYLLSWDIRPLGDI